MAGAVTLSNKPYDRHQPPLKSLNLHATVFSVMALANINLQKEIVTMSSYSNSTPDRVDELLFRSQQTPRTDSSLLGMVSPPSKGSRLPQPSQSPESRSGAMRRFTADSSRAPTLPSVVNQRSSQEAQEYGPSLEKKKLEYERLREQKRRFEAEMQMLDLKQRRDEQELAQMHEDLGRVNDTNQGHQSEPTTPPEYGESSSGFPSAFSRPNRYSTSSITVPPGLFDRPGRSGSQITSPTSATLHSRLVLDEKISSNIISDNRRSNDEDEKAEAVRQDPTSHRSTNAYSMPVTKTRSGLREMTLDQTNTARFLFGDEDTPTSSGVSNYLQMNATEDNFPILVRREDYPGLKLSASSAALDLALSQCTGPESNTWNANTTRHRPSRSQHGIPLSGTQPSGSASLQKPNGAETPASNRQSYRHSLDLNYRQSFDASQDNTPKVSSPANSQLTTPPKLQSSYTTSDASTARTTTNGAGTTNTGPHSHAQQHFHNHNASLGRIPHGAVNSRLSRELTPAECAAIRESQNVGFPSIQSTLHANAPAFGPALAKNMSQASISAPMSQNTQSYSTHQPYYGTQMMMSGMQNLSMTSPVYPSPNPYVFNGGSAYSSSRPPQSGPRESQPRTTQNRRQNDGEILNKFANVTLESLGGEIYALCKDQHGCRYLQKKLEERNPEEIHQIWLETNQHVIEFMTDPFGNYLCQKLLEYCNNEERTILIENASHDLVRIALNQHGTRALQKMIEHITTQGQIDTIINALRYRVVELIQDLNGNHVIQKCLNKLSSQDAQFIFDAVGKHCIDVGTHRHGCCVLQRCIDHADGEQKAWLIRQISNNAYVLVQDPFGNYVVQYILDLNEPIFTEPLVAMFKGRVCQLSKQKFSSNVIEKCLRCAQESTKDNLIEELLQPNELDRLLRDSFANYVIQTALDYANPSVKIRLIEAILPHLPAIRSTPYGRRIQAKIQGNEGRNSSSTGPITSSEQPEPVQAPLRHSRGNSNTSVNLMNPVVGAYTHSYGTSGPTNNGLLSSRALQSSGPFPSSDQLASPQLAQQPYAYSYPRDAGQSGNNNWL